MISHDGLVFWLQKLPSSWWLPFSNSMKDYSSSWNQLSLFKLFIQFSDADSSFVEGGGQTFQLFNVGLRMAEKCCPNLTHLNISGCGLVSNQLIEQLDNEGK